MRHRHRYAQHTRRSNLTPGMRAALKAAKSQPLRRVHTPGPGRPHWPAHPSTLAAMVRRELVRRDNAVSRRGYRMDLWAITEAGVEALKPVEVVRRDRLRLLRVPGGSTRMMQLGTWVDARMPEPEEMQDAA